MAANLTGAAMEDEDMMDGRDYGVDALLDIMDEFEDHVSSPPPYLPSPDDSPARDDDAAPCPPPPPCRPASNPSGQNQTVRSSSNHHASKDSQSSGGLENLSRGLHCYCYSIIRLYSSENYHY